MIEFLRGTLVACGPVSAVLDVNGIGYSVQISLPTYETLPEIGCEVTILTHFHVRDDSMQLFGFSSEMERELFRRLMSIAGIGARTALTILSGVSPTELRSRVLSGDITGLTAIPGIGRKTAERIIVELKDSIARLAPVSDEESVLDKGVRFEALMALQALGYQRQAAEKAVATVLRDAPGSTSSEIIKESLKILNR